MSNLVDQIIGYLSPSAAVERERARLAMKVIQKHKRKYDGASKGKRLSKWKTSSTSINEENLSALSTLRNRSRDLARNNPWAASAVDKFQTNLVGDGIVPQFFLHDPEMIGGADLLKKCQRDWYEWTESSDFSADGQLSFYGTQSLSARSILEAGEFVSRKIINPKLNSKIQIQLYEPDFIDSSKNEKLKSGNIVVQGIEFDRFSRRVALWLFARHPGDENGDRQESKRHDIGDFHNTFEHWRIGQIRGVSGFAPVIVKLRDFDEYQDYQLLKQKISACFTGVITRNIDSEVDDDDIDDFEDINPGLFVRAAPGEAVTFSDPPSVEGYRDFSSVTTQAISAGLGISREALTNDFSDVNFTSARAGKQEFIGKMKRARMMYLYPTYNKYFAWFREAQLINGNNFFPIGVNWSPPKTSYLDPLKEIKANSEAINSGQISISQVIRESGQDPDEMFAEISRERKKLKELGITIFDAPQKTEAKSKTDESEDEGEDDDGKKTET